MKLAYKLTEAHDPIGVTLSGPQHNSSVFPAYLARTILEFLLSLLLTLYMLTSGVGELVNWNTQNLQDIDIRDLVLQQKQGRGNQYQHTYVRRTFL